jgi:hypothetical protein
MTIDQWKKLAAYYEGLWRLVLPKATIALWYKVLQKFEADEVEAAIMALASTEAHPPYLADIVGYIEAARAAVARDKAREEWRQEQARRDGRYAGAADQVKRIREGGR